MRWLGIKVTMLGVVASFLIGGASAWADFTFGQPVNMGPNDDQVGATINLNCSNDDNPFVTADGLQLYFTSTRTGQEGCVFGNNNVWVSTRPTTDDPWGPPEPVGPPINTPDGESSPVVSPNGLELYFERYYRDSDSALHVSVWVARRPARTDSWDEPERLDLLGDGEENEGAPALSADGLELYFTYCDFVGQISRIYVAKRETTDSPWGVPTNIGSAVNDWGCMVRCNISSDGLVLVFNDWWNCSPQPGGFGQRDIWLSRRTTKDSAWEPPVNLGPRVNTPLDECAPMISADGSTLYFSSDRLGGSGWGNRDLWQAPILPVVDFDDDREVGMSDLLLMIDCLDTDEPLCDIGPMPWGDGAVNEADLEVLMGHWGETYLVIVDDFESYDDATDAGTAIWQTWIDGFDNGTGSLSGYVSSSRGTFCETSTIHSGAQAMPFAYDNDGTLFDGQGELEMTGLPYYSETQRTWAEPQDWTRKDVEVLSLWFYGDPGNAIEAFYVALEDSAGNRKDIKHPDPVALTTAEWQQWRIPLADFTHVDPTSIETMYIGIGDPAATEPGGSGLVRIDDIELHRPFGQ